MKRTRQERLRLGTLFVLVCLFFAVVVIRLGHLQIILHPQYSKIVSQQSTSMVSIPAERGRIYDRHGTVIADNVRVSSLYAYPVGQKQLQTVSRYLERFFDLPGRAATGKFGLAPRKFRWIQRCLTDVQADRIEADAPRGLYLRHETQRVYPFDLVGRQVLGFTDIDHHGLAGVELFYDSLLAGQKGLADLRRDGLRNTFRVKETASVKPRPGQSLVLTIDWPLQEIVQQELIKGVQEYDAKAGMAVFMDCHNGDILAIAHYDPDEQNRDKPVKLRAVSDQFEPGSVFKAITVAALLEAELVALEDSIYCEEGRFKIGRRYLHDDKKRGWLTFEEVVQLSSNIGLAKCAVELGGDELYRATRDFGIGQKTALGLPGEARGHLVRPARWSDFNVAALAMGHAVAVTPLQLAVAFAAIANGGQLLRPRLILGCVDEDGFKPFRRTAEVVRSVMSESTAATLCNILRGVVKQGTAEPVNSPVISIAGKTGTAEIPDLVNRRYFKNRFIASFAGFFPFEKPRIAGIVILHEPEPIHYGGWTAGPVFRRIAERHLVLRPDLFNIDAMQLARNPRSDAGAVRVPDLVGRELTLATGMADRCGLKLRASSQEGNVVWQYPAPDRLILGDEEILTVVESLSAPGITMMDLTGLSIRQAAAFLEFAGLACRVTGNGRVMRQSVKSGARLAGDEHCQLQCRPL
ncbi:MAG: penicillin-binding transpeptidase domain-containing protein [bacterium]